MILFPVPTNVPPHEPEYHCAVTPAAVPPVKVSVVEEPLQMEFVPVIPEGATGALLTVTIALPDIGEEQDENPTPFSILTKL